VNITTATISIITTDANELLKPVHDRMPVIVPKDKEAFWINPGVQDQEALLSLLVPYPSDEMKMSEGFIPIS
jgi:putative SOS response-associated peptidase YedK